MGAVCAATGAAIVSLVLLTGTSLAQTAPADPPDIPRPLASLKTVKAPEPPNLSDFVQDRATAIQLGKAFFWDMQMGSDGVTACASCHYQAGADVRSKNTLSPGLLAGDTHFQIGGPNAQLSLADFPFHRLVDPDDAHSIAVDNMNDVVGAQGVFGKDFNLPGIPGALTKGVDSCTQVSQ